MGSGVGGIAPELIRVLQEVLNHCRLNDEGLPLTLGVNPEEVRDWRQAFLYSDQNPYMSVLEVIINSVFF